MNPLYMSLHIFTPWQTRHEISLFISTAKWWDNLPFSAFPLYLANHSPSRGWCIDSIFGYGSVILCFTVFHEKGNLLLLLTPSPLLTHKPLWSRCILYHPVCSIITSVSEIIKNIETDFISTLTYCVCVCVLTCARKCANVWKCMCLSVCVSACMSVFISMMLIISHNTHVTVTSFKPCKPSATQDPTQDFLYIPPKD